MTFRVQGEILMDAEQAKAQLRSMAVASLGAARDLRALGVAGVGVGRGMDLVTRATKSAEDSAQVFSGEMDQLRARFDPLFALSQRYEAELSELNRAHRLGALTAGQYDTALDRLNNDFSRHATGAQGMATANRAVAASNRLAAGSMGNLVAQGNDVITMLAAGQNPLQLALQQGTQITQVIGPLGAAGAFRALGGAILSMLSPINLITIGAIAATAAVVNWFRSGSDEAETFEEGIEALGSRIDSLRDKIEDASRTRVELAEEFGESFVTRAQDLLDRIVDAEKRAAARDAREKIGTFLDETGIDFERVNRNRELLPGSVDAGLDAAEGNARFRLARELELTSGFFGRLSGENRQLVDRVLNDLAEVQSAAEGTVEEQAAALDALIQSYGAAAEAANGINETERQRLDNLDQLRLKLAQVLQLQSQDPANNRETEQLLTFLEVAVKRTEEQQRANAAAEEMLGTMTEQVAVSQAIARFGSDSAAVTRLRAQFALDAKLEEIEALGVSEDKKEAMRDVAQRMFEIATTDISGTIRDAANEAARLSSEVRGAVDAMFDLRSQGEFQLQTAQIRAEFKDDPVGRAGALAAARFDRDAAPVINASDGDLATLEALEADRDAAVERAREIARLNEQARPARSHGGRGGAARTEAEREREAVLSLITAKQRELDVLRESDPVQREMIRLRERLTAATPEQRAEVEALTAAHHAEIEALQRRDEFEQILGDVLIEANSLKDVWQGIGDMILRAAREAVFLGTGPLSGLLGGGGGSGGGGLIGGLVSGLGGLFGFADGGLPAARLPALAGGGDARESRPGIVLGSGTARSDSILARISAGEFIMTGEATARNRPVLEAMNAGAVIPGFAGGGLPLPRAVTAPASASAASGPGGVTRLLVEPSEMFRVVATETARGVSVDVMGEALAEFSRNTLPHRVEEINSDPRRVG